MAEQCNSGYSSDFQTPLSVNGTGFFSWVDHFVNPSKSEMLPTVDRNADAYYYRYYFRFNDENMISTVLISEWIEV